MFEEWISDFIIFFVREEGELERGGDKRRRELYNGDVGCDGLWWTYELFEYFTLPTNNYYVKFTVETI